VTFLLWLDSIPPNQRPFVGEKAFLLSQLQQKGYPVLPGFVITSNTFAAFLELIDNCASLLADFPQSSLYLDVDDPRALQLVAQQSAASIEQTSLPTPWLQELEMAVSRLNSPPLVWQLSLGFTLPLGQLFSDTYSNSGAENLEIALKNAWIEFFRAKSLFFWQRQAIPLEKIPLAVLVQPLFNVLTSGYVILSPESIEIQATLGLSLSLVRGENHPDIYRVWRGDGNLMEQSLGSKTKVYQPSSEDTSLSITWLDNPESYCLDSHQVTALVNLTQRLLEDYPTLQSLEWQIVADNPLQIYIRDIQVQPSNTLTPLPLLRGLGVAHGAAIAPIHILHNPEQIPPGRILVASHIDPDWLPWLKTARGLITEVGSATSHGAILAREFGIPGIVQASNATQVLQEGELVSIDGHTGLVYAAAAPAEPAIALSPSPAPPHTYPIATQLFVNLSQRDNLGALAQLPVDGVGLLRSEWLLLELLREQSLRDWLRPSQQEKFIECLVERVNDFTQAFYPRPVFYRSLDGAQGRVITSEKDLLGERGTYQYLLDPTLFDLELQVLKQVQESQLGNIHLILPFVRSVEEFVFCRQRVERVGLSRLPNFKLMIMAEVPSVIFLLSQYVKEGVKGIAIGSNDLLQLLLGTNRENHKLFNSFNSLNPAFLTVLKQLIQEARTLGISCSICGQAPVENPELIDYLVTWGITSISVEPNSVESTYRAIARAEQRLLLEKVHK
jgi:pyruvate,water dikinase